MPRLRRCNDPQRLYVISWSLTHLSRIAQNAVASPFLRLPQEIRDKIYSELLGDRLIHLKYEFIADVSFEKDDDLYAAMHRESGEECSRTWRHVVCECDCPEIKSDRKTTYPNLDGGEEEVSWDRSHGRCDRSLDDSIYLDHETLSLQILRSCRQTYNDANRILWSTNTFSFNDGMTFERFVGTRSLIQKHMLKSLRFHIRVDWEIDEHKEWNTALKIATVRSLQGLRQLRLRIEWSIASGVYRLMKQHSLFPYCTRYIEGLQKLATLPLTSVEIAVKKFPFRERQSMAKSWSKAERTEYAEVLRKMLLGPKGADDGLL